MKHIAVVLALFIIVISAGNQASGADTVLTAAEVNKLFSDKTMTIMSTRSKKKGGTEQPFKAHTSSMGSVRALSDEGASDSRQWSVSENGRFCFSRSFKRKHGGSTCGFIVTDGSGTYRLYKSKNVKVKSGQVVGAKKKDLLLIFSNFTSGNTL